MSGKENLRTTRQRFAGFPHALTALNALSDVFIELARLRRERFGQ